MDLYYLIGTLVYNKGPIAKKILIHHTEIIILITIKLLQRHSGFKMELHSHPMIELFQYLQQLADQ